MIAKISANDLNSNLETLRGRRRESLDALADSVLQCGYGKTQADLRAFKNHEN
jgi:hypothetical protein